MNTLKMKDWGLGLGKHVVIAGPCSVETEKQIDDLCNSFEREPQIGMFRAGVWKPRTRPGNFEGLGEEALPWLQKVKSRLHIPVCVEVANANHVEAALKHDIDVLWIGARTTVNPFSVQEIADSLRGVDIPVMVKNPINPDLALWVGALERMYDVGINKLAAIHRGFADPYDKIYRNKPNWNLAMQLKLELPEIEIINDPSHISGKWEMVQSVAQRALNFGMDGLMIETHPNPAEAWSDARQQLNPEQLLTLLKEISFRERIDFENQIPENLKEMRDSIDHIDQKLIDLLSDRFHLIDQVGAYKKAHELSVYQGGRWKDVLESRIKLGTEKDMSEKFMKNLLIAIHDESIKRQEKQIANKDVEPLTII
ncbi:MAG: 3-deoxy-7-phosphoheptulonate synthase [Bacteroidetes bacterium]|nr:MAG: 3-deoxy-7-phosphoheptulonate synthase [Bacteroidota bacterium]